MKVFKENRKKRIFRNCIFLFVFFTTYNIIFQTDKTINENVMLFVVASISVIFSTKKIRLQFNEQNRTLLIYNSDTLGGGKKYLINYEDLSFNVKTKNFLETLINKPEVIIYKNKSKVIKVVSLTEFNDSSELYFLIESLNKKSN